jgi:hypothetical protein
VTSTADTHQHPDVSEISDLTEGLLSPSRGADVRHHVDSCVLCSDVHTSLEEIRTLLGTLPGPQQMPDDIVGRIDAALAAEAPFKTVKNPGERSVSRETEQDTSQDQTAEWTVHQAVRGGPPVPDAGRPGVVAVQRFLAPLSVQQWSA